MLKVVKEKQEELNQDEKFTIYVFGMKWESSKIRAGMRKVNSKQNNCLYES